MQNDPRLRRSTLSVPANREKMIRKAPDLDADAIMFDLEDSVPVEDKEESRKGVVRGLLEMRDRPGVRCFRINDMQSPYAYRDVIEVVEAAGQALDILVVPKVEEPAQITAVDYLVTQIERRMGWESRIGLDAIIETARGMCAVEEIAFCSERLQGLVFGVADYGASLDALGKGSSGHGEEEDFYPGHRWHYPLSRIAVAARAAGLQAIDAPYGDLGDERGLRRSCTLSAALGFDGKWVVHPGQLAVINEMYAPAEEDVERAKRVLEAYEAGPGGGSVALDGSMIDAASVRLARARVAKWERIQSRKAER
jgi:citrate lyase beta subunit